MSPRSSFLLSQERLRKSHPQKQFSDYRVRLISCSVSRGSKYGMWLGFVVRFLYGWNCICRFCVHNCRLQSAFCAFAFARSVTFTSIPPTVLLTLYHTHHYCPLLQARRRRPCPSSCTSTANRTSGTPATRTTAASWPATGRSWSSPSTSVLVCWVSSTVKL